MRWLHGADQPSAASGSQPSLGLEAIYAAQAGYLQDLDTIADVIYQRQR